MTIPASLLLRCPPEQQQIRHAAEVPSASITVRQAVTSPQFISLVLTNFFCCATRSGPIFHAISYVALYFTRGMLGLGAFLIAITFWPFAKLDAAALTPA